MIKFVIALVVCLVLMLISADFLRDSKSPGAKFLFGASTLTFLAGSIISVLLVWGAM